MTGVFEAIGFGLAVAGGIDLTLTYGQKLSNRVSELKRSAELTQKLKSFNVEPERRLLGSRLRRGQAICNDPHGDPGIKEELDRTFVEMQQALRRALDAVEIVEKDPRHKRYIVLENKNRQVLDSAVADLKRHTEHYRDVILEVHMNERGASAAFLPSTVFQLEADTAAIPVADGVRLQMGNLAYQVGKVSPRSGYFIVETWPYSAKAKTQLEGDIKYLAELLSATLYPGGILNVVGYVDDVDKECYELVFDVPGNLVYRKTLQSLLGEPALALDVRVGICKQLAEAVLHIHQLTLVHKNFSTANTIVMQNTAAPSASDDRVYLTNWRLARIASAATNKAGEGSWWKGIYLHPKRQVQLGKDKYNMGHDIYSLGVCMLEVLLSHSLVQFSNGNMEISAKFKARADALGFTDRNRAISPQGLSEPEIYTLDKHAVQDTLKSLANTDLPAAVGTQLTNLIVSCLSCLEGGFGGVSFAGNDVEVGMNFIHLIKSVLGQVSV